MKKLLSAKEVAKILKISKQAVNINIQSGKLKATKVGNFWVIYGSDLKKFMKNR